jgi:GT2 family glycosyltransferase
MKQSIKVYAVITTYNGSKWVNKCFGSLRSSIIPLTVIVIDNHSEDDTVSLIEKNYPEVSIYQSNKNLGFGQANNIGIRKAINEGADFVFLLNQDAWIESNTVDYLVKTHLLNSLYGILSPIHLSGAGDSLDQNFLSYLLNKTDPGLISDLYCKSQNMDNIYTSTFINAAAWLVSATCINKVGLFNPSFYHYGEDSDFINRMIYHQLKLGVCPKVKIYHDRNDREEILVKTKPKEYFERIGINYKINFLDLQTNPYKFLLKSLIRLMAKSISAGCQFHFSEMLITVKKMYILLFNFIQIRGMRKQCRKEKAFYNCGCLE